MMQVIEVICDVSTCKRSGCAEHGCQRSKFSDAANRLLDAEAAGAMDAALQFFEDCPDFTFEGSVQRLLPR